MKYFYALPYPPTLHPDALPVFCPTVLREEDGLLFIEQEPETDNRKILHEKEVFSSFEEARSEAMTTLRRRIAVLQARLNLAVSMTEEEV
jgi:hypothetical protein